MAQGVDLVASRVVSLRGRSESTDRTWTIQQQPQRPNRSPWQRDSEALRLAILSDPANVSECFDTCPYGSDKLPSML
jgi:hypothetical protein